MISRLFSLSILALTFQISNGISMDLKDVTSFQSGTFPVILRSTKSYGDIVALTITAKGGVTLTDKAGALDLVVDTVTKGTPSYSKEDIDRIFTEAGAVFSIDARADSIELSLKCLKKFLPTLLPIVAEMITVPLFRTEEVDLVKRQMTAALKNEQEHPDAMIGLLSHKAFYQGHPYLNRAGGYLETLPGLNRNDLVELLPKIFNKQNIFFTSVGDLTQGELSQLIQNYFGGIPDGKAVSSPAVPISNPINDIGFEKFDAPTTYFMARFKAPALKDEDYAPLTIAVEILGNRLFEEVRTKRALTYSVSASLGSSLSNSGVLYVSSTQIPEAVKVIYDEVKRIQTELVPAEDLRNQVSKFISSWWMGREAPMSQARIFNYYEISGLGWAKSNMFLERIQRTTAEQVRAAAQKYLKDYTVSMVGPQSIDVRDLIPGMIKLEGTSTSSPALDLPPQ